MMRHGTDNIAPSTAANPAPATTTSAPTVEPKPTVVDQATAAVGQAWEATKHAAETAAHFVHDNAVAAKEAIVGHPSDVDTAPKDVARDVDWKLHDAKTDTQEALGFKTKPETKIDDARKAAHDAKIDAKDALGIDRQQPLGEQAKAAAADAWETTKDYATAAKNTVLGKTDAEVAADKADWKLHNAKTDAQETLGLKTKPETKMDDFGKAAHDTKNDVKDALGIDRQKPVSEQVKDSAANAWETTKDTAVAVKDAALGKTDAEIAADKADWKLHKAKTNTQEALGLKTKPETKIDDARKMADNFQQDLERKREKLG